MDGWNPINNGINHLSTGDSDFFHPQYGPEQVNHTTQNECNACERSWKDYPWIGLACDGSAVPSVTLALRSEVVDRQKPGTPFSRVPFGAKRWRWDANFAMGSRLGEPFCVVNQCESCLSFLFYPFLYACNSTCSCITFIYRVQRWDSVDGLWWTKGPDNACHVQWHPGGLKTCPIGPSSRNCLRTARTWDLRTGTRRFEVEIIID